MKLIYEIQRNEEEFHTLLYQFLRIEESDPFL